MSSQRIASPLGTTEHRVQIDSGTLVRSSSPAPRILDGNLQIWRSSLLGTPHIKPTAYQLIGEFQHRIDGAGSLGALARVAADVTEVHNHYQQKGLIQAPRGGDDDVKAVIKDAISDQLSVLQKVIFAASWSGADNGVDEGLQDGAKAALWELSKALIEAKCGKFAVEATKAIRRGDWKGILNVAAEACNALATSFSHRDGILREVLRIMRRNGLVFDKTSEYAVRRYVGELIGRISGSISAIAKLLGSPIIVFTKILLTPSTVPNDAGELYLTFKGLERRISEREREAFGRSLLSTITATWLYRKRDRFSLARHQRLYFLRRPEVWSTL